MSSCLSATGVLRARRAHAVAFVTSSKAFTSHGAILDHPAQAGSCLDQRLCGIGLFRTEFLVLEAGRVPTEEEQLSKLC